MNEKLLIEPDNFNSEIFHLKFGNITYYKEDILSIDITNAILKSKYDFYGVKIDSKDFNAIFSFQKAGFYLVDCLLTYEFDSSKSQIPNNEFSIDFTDKITDVNINKLANIAADVFKIDRFHSDPNLLKCDADEYYRRWVINSFNGFSDGAIMPVIENNVVGFTTYNINNVNNEISTMVLSAVDPNYMGLGVYFNMIKKGTIELLKYSNKIRVGTQVDNIPVQRTWQKLGYKLIDVKYIFHYKKN